MLLTGQIAIDIVAECLLGHGSSQTAANSVKTGGESSCQLLNGEEYNEYCDAKAVHYGVDLVKAIRFHSTNLCNKDANYLCILLQVIQNLVFLIMINREDLWVRHHVQSHEEMDHECPLNCLACISCQSKTIVGWLSVVSQEESLVHPVLDHAQNKSSNVQDWHGRRVHHDYKEHGNENGVSVLNLEDRSKVKLLVFWLYYLLSLASIEAAPSVAASLTQSLAVKGSVYHREHSIQKTSDGN